MFKLANKVVLKSFLASPLTAVPSIMRIKNNRFLFSNNSNNFNDKTTNINNTWNPEQSPEEIRTSQIVAKNVGLSKFITRTYNTTALSIVGALSAAHIGSSIPLFLINPMATILVGGIATIGSFWGMQSMKPKSIVQNELGVPIYKTENPASRIALFTLGVLSLGLSASPLFASMQMLNPSIIPSAIGITAGIFGGASAMAYMMPKDKMLGYGRILMGSLIGLIGMQLVGLGAAFFVGPNILSTLLFTIDNYAGILLFCGLIGYDTHVAIKQYQSGIADHLGMTVQLLLNFWNILIRVMSILSNRN